MFLWEEASKLSELLLQLLSLRVYQDGFDQVRRRKLRYWLKVQISQLSQTTFYNTFAFYKIE